MTAVTKIPIWMTVPEFLAWNPGDGRRWQLVDGTPQAMAPASLTHGDIQSEVVRLIGNHFVERRSPCRITTAPGVVPRVRARHNCRIPDLAVTCAPHGAKTHELTEPVLVIEILSPSNEAETWANVWAFSTIPSVREILVLHSTEVAAELLRRQPDGAWPEDPEPITSGDISLESIAFRAPLTALYRTSRLAGPHTAD
jgi:Uma2 family endonuclease